MPAVFRLSRPTLGLALLLLVTLAMYAPGLSGGFVFDDFGNLVDNPAFAQIVSHQSFWQAIWSSGSGPTDRPISMFSFALQAWFTGLAPWPLKLVNVLIHLGNGMLIFLLGRAVLRQVMIDQVSANQAARWLVTPETLALLVAGAWLLAPMQLTAVLYVVQRMESLSALFVLAGLLAYWHGRQRQRAGRSGGWRWVLGGLLGGTLLATLAKETGVMLPVYAFLLEVLVLRGRGATGSERGLVPLFLLVLALPGGLGLLATLPAALDGRAFAGRPFDLAERLWTEGRVLFDYLHWLIAPAPNDLSLYHDDVAVSTGWLAPWTTLAGGLGIGALIVAAVALRQRAPLFALGVLWFFAGHALVSTYLPLELVYEHRNYLPSFGVFLALFGLMLAWSPAEAERARVMRTLMLSAALALIALYAGITALRAQVWGNPFRLAYFEATTHPDSPRANYDLARLMMITAPGVSSPSFGMGVQLMDKASQLPGASIQADQALIFMSAKNGLPIHPAWWADIRQKLDHQPPSAEDVSALYSLVQCGFNGVCHYPPEAVQALGQTLRLAVARYPDNDGLITLLANYEANITHDFPVAYRLMQQAVTLDPRHFAYWNNLVTMQIAAGLLDMAATGIERMTEFNPKGTHDAEIAAARAALAKKQAEAALPQNASPKQNPDKDH
ncbi:tetratricopeptide repeat protein [Halothiobacillus sp. DCM-1]|uniref:tetratricopeptide repeat protein n=1 Tax=Halothiobacillus sp. DCM-1 TaxID=3112558 RepID=UPI00324E14C2